MIYAFGDYELDEALFELRRAQTRVAIEPKVFNVLAYLIINRDRVVTKDELIAQCWPGCFISDAALVRCVVQARKAVGDDGAQQGMIRTVRGRGYRFVAAVTTGSEDALSHQWALSTEVQQLLALASVIGHEFRLEVLEYLLSLSHDHLLVVLEQAVTDNVLEEIPGVVGGYRFAQPHVQKALYTALSSPQRVALHRAVGAALETLYDPYNPSHLQTIAHHLYEAALIDGNTDRAIDYAIRAAEWATTVTAFFDAARHYACARELLDLHGVTNTYPYCELLLGLGEVQSHCGDIAGARFTLSQAGELGRKLGSREVQARAALSLGRAVLQRATLHGIVETTHAPVVAEVLCQTTDTAQRAELLSHLAVAQVRTEPHRAAELSHDAIALAVQIHDPSTQIMTLLGRHCTMYGPDNIEEQLATAVRVVQLAQQTNRHEWALLGHHWSITDLLRLGDLTAAERAMQACQHLIERTNSIYYQAVATSLHAMYALLAGCSADSEYLVNKAYTLAGQVQDRDLLVSVVEPQRLFLYLQQDRRTDFEALCVQWAQTARSRLVWRCVLAWFSSLLGWNEEAKELFEMCAHGDFTAIPRDGDWLASLSHLALVCVRYKDRRRAALLYNLLLPYAAYNATNGPYLCYGSVAHYLGLLAAMMKLWEKAQQHFAAALAMHKQLHAEPLQASTQYAYAKMLIQQQGLMADHAKARVLLHSAVQVAESLHLTRLMTRIQALQHKLDH